MKKQTLNLVLFFKIKFMRKKQKIKLNFFKKP